MIVFFLLDFPNTWNALDPDLKAVANLRLALDAGVTDVDVEGLRVRSKA